MSEGDFPDHPDALSLHEELGENRGDFGSWIDEVVRAWDSVAEELDDDIAADVEESERPSRVNEENSGDLGAQLAHAEHGSEIELDIASDDGDQDAPSDEGQPAKGPSPAIEVESVLGGSDLAGSCSVTSLVDALSLAGVEDVDGIFAGMDADRLDPREAVQALDVAGVPARVEYTDVGDLLERLSTGSELVLGAGEPYAVVAISPAAGELVIEPLGGGDRTVIDIDVFGIAWEAVANELMVVTPETSGVALGVEELCLLPLGRADIMLNGGL